MDSYRFSETLSRSAYDDPKLHESHVGLVCISPGDRHKGASGKFPEAVSVELDFLNIPKESGFEFLSLPVEAALLAGRLAGTHKDPFDRMLAGQALVLDIPIISADSELDAFGVRRIW